MSTPADLKYTKEHEWVRNNNDDTVTIGVTDFAQGELGDIVFVELDEIGTECEKEQQFGTVEAVKTVSDLFAPVSGKIVEVNEQLEDESELLKEDTYGEGWMIKLEIEDNSELDELMSAEEYEKIIA